MTRWFQAAAAIAAAALVAGCGGGTERSSDCARRFDASRWVELMRPPQNADEQYAAERRALADEIVRCGLLRDQSRPEATRVVGVPPASARYDNPDGTETWKFPLGPDALSLDSEVLWVRFDAAGRVVDVEIGTD